MTRIKTDCFGWNELKGCCDALTDLMCKRGGCPFYKPCCKRQEEQQQAELVRRRLHGGPRQVYIDQPVVRSDGQYYATAREAAAQMGVNAEYIIRAAN